MKIPLTLKIGNLTYYVSYMSRETASDKNAFAQSSQSRQTIKIEEGLGKEMTLETLWHEIIHQILKQKEFLQESSDEKLVTAIASGIVQVIKDNKSINE